MVCCTSVPTSLLNFRGVACRISFTSVARKHTKITMGRDLLFFAEGKQIQRHFFARTLLFRKDSTACNSGSTIISLPHPHYHREVTACLDRTYYTIRVCTIRYQVRSGQVPSYLRSPYTTHDSSFVHAAACSSSIIKTYKMYTPHVLKYLNTQHLNYNKAPDIWFMREHRFHYNRAMIVSSFRS